MKSILPRAGAALAAVFLASTAALAQTAPAEPASDKGDAKETVEAPAETAETKSDDERICRHIKLDMSSRRKTKICRTTEEWRELGNPR